MKLSDRILSVLLILGAVITLAYWINYFRRRRCARIARLLVQRLRGCAFPVADRMDGAVHAGRRLRAVARLAQQRACLGLMAGKCPCLSCGNGHYIHTIEHGLYAMLPSSGAMVAETSINATALALGIATLLMCWQRAASRSIFG